MIGAPTTDRCFNLLCLLLLRFFWAAPECRGSPNNRKCDAVTLVFHYHDLDEVNVDWGAHGSHYSREYEAGGPYGKVEKTPRSDVWVIQKLNDCTIGEVIKHKIYTISRLIIVLCCWAPYWIQEDKPTQQKIIFFFQEKKLIAWWACWQRVQKTYTANWPIAVKKILFARIGTYCVICVHY